MIIRKKYIDYVINTLSSKYIIADGFAHGKDGYMVHYKGKDFFIDNFYLHQYLQRELVNYKIHFVRDDQLYVLPNIKVEEIFQSDYLSCITAFFKKEIDDKTENR